MNVYSNRSNMNILLAVDESSASQIAIEEVAGRPWPEATTVEVLTVVEAGQVSNGVNDAAVALLRGAGLRALGKVAAGDAKAVIAARAEAMRPDLIVVGSHRPSALTDLFVGNVAVHTLRHAGCSVAIVRARLDDGLIPRKILLAVDGSAYAEAAARAIAERPWPARSEVRVLSVVEVVLPAMHALFDPPFVQSDEVQRLRVEAVARAQRAVSDAVAILAPSGLAVSETISVLLDGTKEVILQEARDWGADWLFVGSHGRQGAERLLMGSVSEAIAMQANCSVEVVRARVG
ncbi:MAG: hypothetical protein EXQ57_06180 [Bryobacterales bacterium]|nr:hypothetical protein [Bryobacterales bacterium]